jgi:hypothetical protein
MSAAHSTEDSGSALYMGRPHKSPQERALAAMNVTILLLTPALLLTPYVVAAQNAQLVSDGKPRYIGGFKQCDLQCCTERP